jgi:hypothetical protein
MNVKPSVSVKEVLRMLRSFSYLFYAVSLALLVYGAITMFYYGDYSAETNISGSKAGHIVGGDAYNYIIIGIRGVGIILGGLLFSVVASALVIIEAIRNKEVQRVELSSKHEAPAVQ